MKKSENTVNLPFDIDAKKYNSEECHCLQRIEEAICELCDEGYPGGMIAKALHILWQDLSKRA